MADPTKHKQCASQNSVIHTDSPESFGKGLLHSPHNDWKCFAGNRPLPLVCTQHASEPPKLLLLLLGEERFCNDATQQHKPKAQDGCAHACMLSLPPYHHQARDNWWSQNVAKIEQDTE